MEKTQERSQGAARVQAFDVSGLKNIDHRSQHIKDRKKGHHPKKETYSQHLTSQKVKSEEFIREKNTQDCSGIFLVP